MGLQHDSTNNEILLNGKVVGTIREQVRPGDLFQLAQKVRRPIA